MTKEQYFEKAKYIWKNYVPKSGQSDFVQGELLRAIEKLRDEAQRNGNGNWDEGHKILAEFIKKTLVDSKYFDSKENNEIIVDIDRLLDYDNPYLEDFIYDNLSNRIVDFFIQNPEPIKHIHNNNLHR